MAEKKIISVLRYHWNEWRTLSLVFVDTEFVCYGLELPWRQNKRNKSCVPDGEYPAVFEYSPRFGCDLIELKEVPNRSEIKFHRISSVDQLAGCIGVSTGIHDNDRSRPLPVRSRSGLDRLHDRAGVERADENGSPHQKTVAKENRPELIVQVRTVDQFVASEFVLPEGAE